MSRRQSRAYWAATAILTAFATVAALATTSASDGQPERSAPASGNKPPTKAETDRAGLLLRSPKPGPAGFVGDPYPLDICIVDGKKLGADAVTIVLKDVAAAQEGRQLKFCCPKCEETFRQRPGEFTPKLDEAIDALQGPSYPLRHCLVMIEETLGSDHQAVVYGNRAYHFCCKKCVNNFNKNTARYVGAYEKELATKQRSKYPLTKCIVGGTALPEKPYEIIVGQQLLRVADEAAAKKLLEDPAPYLARLDEAYKKSPNASKEPAKHDNAPTKEGGKPPATR